MLGLAARSHRGCPAAAARQSSRLGAMAKRVIALDFDGVICDSVGESSLSAIKAAKRVWPELFDTPEADARREELVAKMKVVRPVVETGYENIVQIRCLLEGMDPHFMLDHWHSVLPECMQRWGLERTALVHAFGSVRDEWIAQDLQGWLAPNAIYPGVADSLAAVLARDEVYIVTTKQAHYTEILLRDMAGVPFPPERIFSQTVSGRPKTEVLAALAERHPGAAGLVFVEDKLATLEKVAAASGYEQWELYLVSWGYNTPRERQRASSSDRISVIGPGEFDALLRG